MLVILFDITAEIGNCKVTFFDSTAEIGNCKVGRTHAARRDRREG